MKAGDKLTEGVAVDVNEAGVLVGRVADVNELVPPPGHSLHILNGERVFLSQDQARIPADGLHPLAAARRRKGKR